MAFYLKKFSTHSEYEQYINGSGVMLPNVSICKTEGDVHYNSSTPPTETKLIAKYYVESESSTIMLFYIASGSGSGSGSGGEIPFSAMEIDGIEQSEAVNEYTFNTTGEHTVKYTLIDPTSIGDKAFQNCTDLTSINIPYSVTRIGSGAFYGCSSLTSIDIPNSVTSIGDGAFRYCDGLTSCTIGTGVTSIEYMTFEGCSSLTSVTIGSGVTSIGNEAFYNCSGLTSIVSNPTTPPDLLGESVFYGVGENGILTVPSNSQGYCDWIGGVNLPSSWTIEGVTCGGSGSGA